MSHDEPRRIANARLYPSLTNPNYLVLRSRRLLFAGYLQGLPGNLTVLDVGARYQPYRPLLDGKLRKYVGLDVERTELVDVLASGELLPFRDETFDLVIATCVFEYFSDPREAAKEIHRVLKPGGSLLASFNAAVPRFVDQERWRYLPLGIRTIFASFSSLRLTPEVRSLGGFCRLINLGLHDFLKLPALKFAYRMTICPAINVLGFLLETASLTVNDRWAGNYSVVAVK
jgi:SAM-dependent methyltransferase